MLINIHRLRTLGVAVVFGLAGAGAAYALTPQQERPRTSEQEQEQDREAREKLPDVVKRAADRFFGSTTYTTRAATIDEIKQYNVLGTKDGKETKVVYTDDGKVILVRTIVRRSDIPEEVIRNFRQDFKDAEITRMAEVESHFYTIVFEQNDSEKRVRTYPNGRVWQETNLGEQD